MKYMDFDLIIEPGQVAEEYQVAVNTQGGEVRSVMRFSFDKAELRKVRDAVLLTTAPRRGTLTPEEQVVQKFGQELFQTFLAGEILNRYDVSQTTAKMQKDTGLRLKLHILAPELAVLPWEFLYDPRVRDYLCLAIETPIVRYPEVPRLLQPLKVDPPLHILGVIASPDDMVRLDVRREQQLMAKILNDLEKRGLMKLTWLETPTPHELQRAIRKGPWHIFHFIGHGEFETKTQEGAIVLCDEHNHSSRLSATQLGVLLKGKIQLAMLNACKGAEGVEDDLFSSTAATLIQKEIPAVLAMQDAITDDAAIEFTRTFYEALAEGWPVDAAVTEARKAIMFSKPGTLEWGTPVLYMRSPDGTLFDLPEVSPTRSTGKLPPVSQTPPVTEPPKMPPPSPSELRSRLSLLAQRLIKVLDTLAMAEWRERAQRLEQRVSRETCRVLVIGKFGTGKTSFINALLGKKILPERTGPTTALITHIRWGASPRALLHFAATKDGTRRPPQEIPLDQLAQYLAIPADSPQTADSQPYERVELFWPLELCQDNIEIIDTPGLGDKIEREQITLRQLSSVDAAVYVIDCKMQVSMADHQFIETLKKTGHEEIFFLCNRINQIDEEEQDMVMQHCTQQLEPHARQKTGKPVFINSQGALRGRLANDTSQLAQSRVPEMEKKLKYYLAEERTFIKMIRPALDIQEALGVARATLSQRTAAWQPDVRKLQPAFAAAPKEIDPVELDRQEIVAWLSKFRSETRQQVKKAADDFYGDVIRKIDEWTKMYEVKRPVEIMEALSRAAQERVIEEVVKFLNSQVDSQCKMWQASTLQPLLNRRLETLEREYSTRRMLLIQKYQQVNLADALEIAFPIGTDIFSGISIGALTAVKLDAWKVLDFVSDLLAGGQIPTSKNELNRRIKQWIGRRYEQKFQALRNELAESVAASLDKITQTKLSSMQDVFKRSLDRIPQARPRQVENEAIDLKREQAEDRLTQDDVRSVSTEINAIESELHALITSARSLAPRL